MRAAGKPVGVGEALVCRLEKGNRPIRSRRAREYEHLVMLKCAERLGVPVNLRAQGAELDAELMRIATLVRRSQRRAVRRLEHALVRVETVVTA